MKQIFNYRPSEPFILQILINAGYKPHQINWGRTTDLIIEENSIIKKCLIRLDKTFDGSANWWKFPTPTQSEEYDYILFVDVKKRLIESTEDISIYLCPIKIFDNFNNIHIQDVISYIVDSKITPIQQAKNFIQNLDDKYSGKPDFIEMVVKQIKRPSDLRNAILTERGTTCQICGYPGFEKKEGGLYAETHHMIELNNLAPNTLQSWNILVLCPLCHKKFHYADIKSEYLNNKWKIIMEEKEIIIE